MTDPVAPRPQSQARALDAAARRPVQYLGSKFRLLAAIGDAIDWVDPGRGLALDVFSGSGVVAAHLSRDRPVTAVDVQEYSRVLAAALLSPARLTSAAVARLSASAKALCDDIAAGAMRDVLRMEQAAEMALHDGDPEPLCEIVERGSIRAFECGQGPSSRLGAALCQASTELDDVRTPTVLTRYYGGVYFGYAQALELDCLLAVVRGLGDERARTTGLAAVLGAASDSVGSVGSHFAQPIRPRDKQGRPKPGVLEKLVRRRGRDVFAVFEERLRRFASVPGAAHAAAAVCSDYRSFLASHADEIAAVYADPPYTRDHYSRFYHVLETMARGDEPDVSTVTKGGTISLSRGLYRRERHQSPFCIRTEAPAAFRSLFTAVRRFDAPLVLSYSPYGAGTAARPKPRLLRISEVVDIARESFGHIEVRSAGPLSHSRFNLTRLNGSVPADAELLIVCVP